MIRIKDIADMAGVSPTTVSNVIHGNTKKVSPENREKIGELLRRENYIPSLGARMLAGMGSRMAGVIVGPDMAVSRRGMSDPFLGEILTSVERELYGNDRYTVFHQADRPEDIKKLVKGWQVEGVITVGLSREQNLALKKRMDVPMVSIDVYYGGDRGEECGGNGGGDPGEDREGEALPNVGLDDFGGGYLMAAHMLSKGCKRIWFLADNIQGVDRMRRLGAEKALREAGAAGDRLMQVILPHGLKERERKLETVCGDGCRPGDALFFVSDYYACEGMQVLMRQGMEIPKDVMVGGFDDNFLAAMQYPALTTVHQDVSRKGEAAVQKLISLIRGEKPAMDTRLPVRLVVRESA